MVLKVELLSDVYLVCLIHAFSTEKEEVMGLLIGEICDDVAVVSALFLMRRSDKRKDRVEISPEQLTAASIEADRLSQELDNPNLHVIGWYHSHPHITIWPSHVDINTQASYQLMDSNFIGVIFSCFGHENKQGYRVQATCFQSEVSKNGTGYERVEVPFAVVPSKNGCLSGPCLSALLQLPSILLEEEEEIYHTIMKSCSESIVAQLENTAVYNKIICHTLDKVCAPIISLLEERLKHQKREIEKLKKEKLFLEAQLGGEV